jgi:hypothetical protein
MVNGESFHNEKNEIESGIRKEKSHKNTLTFAKMIF